MRALSVARIVSRDIFRIGESAPPSLPGVGASHRAVPARVESASFVARLAAAAPR